MVRLCWVNLQCQASYNLDYSTTRAYCTCSRCGWFVGCFGFNGPLRQYFSLYRAVSQREGEREERIEERKISKLLQTRTYCKRNRPLPYYHPNCRTPRHWKFPQDHRTTRPPQGAGGGCLDIYTLIYPFSPLSPSLWETARYRLKYCIKMPLNPKQPTNH